MVSLPHKLRPSLLSTVSYTDSKNIVVRTATKLQAVADSNAWSHYVEWTPVYIIKQNRLEF